MRAVIRSWWLRQALIFIAAEVLGYLLSVELRDRYPQEVCFVALYFMMTITDDWCMRRAARRTKNAQYAPPAIPHAIAIAGAAPTISKAYPNTNATTSPNAAAARRGASNVEDSTQSNPVIPLRRRGA